MLPFHVGQNSGLESVENLIERLAAGLGGKLQFPTRKENESRHLRSGEPLGKQIPVAINRSV